MAYARDTASDFDLIAEDGRNARAFNPTDVRILFEESKAKIRDILESSNPDKCVVITHFPPAKQLLHPRFSPDKVSSYFTADCLDLIQSYKSAYWFYGHNHWSMKTTIRKTQLYVP